MDLKKIIYTSFFAMAIGFSSCRPEQTAEPEPADPCAAKNIGLSASITNTLACSNTGKVVLRATNSTGFTYQLNNGAFQTDSSFSNLSKGTYTFRVKDAEGCSKSASFTVTESSSKGPLFTAVTVLMASKCNQACHTSGSGGATRGIFNTDCQIVALQSMIVSKSVNGTLGGLTGA